LEEEDPEVSKVIFDTKLAFRLGFTEPEAELFINGKKNPLIIEYGPIEKKPDLEVDIPADMFHEIMLGELTLKKAYATGKIKLRGPIWKAFALEKIFQYGQKHYPDALSELRMES
jgi:putative sterol carrier protein